MIRQVLMTCLCWESLLQRPHLTRSSLVGVGQSFTLIAKPRKILIPSFVPQCMCCRQVNSLCTSDHSFLTDPVNDVNEILSLFHSEICLDHGYECRLHMVYVCSMCNMFWKLSIVLVLNLKYSTLNTEWQLQLRNIHASISSKNIG